MHARTVVSGKKESVPDFDTAEIRFSPVACGCVRGRCVTFAQPVVQPVAAVLVPSCSRRRNTPRRGKPSVSSVYAVMGKIESTPLRVN